MQVLSAWIDECAGNVVGVRHVAVGMAEKQCRTKDEERLGKVGKRRECGVRSHEYENTQTEQETHPK